MTRIWQELAEARRRLQQSEVVGVPTETVYGLAALVNDERAIRSVFEMKERPFFDPLIVHIGRYEDLFCCTRGPLPAGAEQIARRFWPGPLTVVLPKATSISSLITAGADTVGIRLPSHPVARRLARTAGPFVAPSANMFQRTSPTTAQHVRDEFAPNNIFVVDGGAASIGIESTVVGFPQVEIVRVYRLGAISVEELQRELGPSFQVLVTKGRGESSASPSSPILSPGTIDEHYRPAVPLHLLGGLDVEAGVLIAALDRHYRGRGVEVSLDDDPWLCARSLYRQLRESAKEEVCYLYTLRQREPGGIWDAIWDRLQRAQTTLPPGIL